MKLKILDLFCGGGGSATGLHQALKEKGIEHEILGFDIRDMSKIYPFNFQMDDALKVDPFDWDFIWASPPCQAFSFATIKERKLKRDNYPDLIEPVRKILINSKKPYVIENVPRAPIRKDLMLCGDMFNLGVFRHRIFEMNFLCNQIEHKKHRGKLGDGKYFCVVSGGRIEQRNGGLGIPHIKLAQAMDIDWIPLPKTTRFPSKHPLTEAIPPAYSKYIMNEFLAKRKDHTKGLF